MKITDCKAITATENQSRRDDFPAGLLVLKRGFDIAVAALGLLLTAPLLGGIAALIRLTGPGPVFYRQERVGKDQQSFKMIKFRSMVVDADRRGPHVTARGDSRITLVGRVLRRTKMDELPELINVLRGDMSVVGPRPEVPRYVQQYRPEWREVFAVRPGVTDLATLQFRDEESVLELASDRERAYLEVVLPVKMALALWYTRHVSLALDLRILMDTMRAITLGRVVPQEFGPDWAALARRRVATLSAGPRPRLS